MAEGVDKPIDMNGSYRHKVDAKGRMSLPAAFRKVLSEDLVVTLSPDDECLYAFEPQAFEDRIASSAVTTPRPRPTSACAAS